MDAEEDEKEMNQLWGRIANYLANQVIVETLSGSRSFQRFVLRTNARVEQMQDTVKQSQRVKELEHHINRATGKHRSFANQFFQSFSKDLQKNIRKISQNAAAGKKRR